MIPVGKLLLAALASLTVFGLWKIFRFVYNQFTSPIRHLRGPKGTSWIFGNLLDIWDANSTPYEEWVKQYGSTMKFKSFFYSNRLLTMDTQAINHILTHSNDYHKPPEVRHNISRIFGKSIISVEGAQHLQQRRIVNPAFGPAQIRALTDIFFEKAVQLCDVLSSEIAEDPAGTTIGARLDIMPWVNRVTFDVIGLAGFNYNIDAINTKEKPNGLNEALAILGMARNLDVPAILQILFPHLRIFPSDDAGKVRAAQRTMACIGKELLSGAKAAVRASATEKDKIEKNSLHGRDILSLLVKANMATDIPESQRMSDEDVWAQIHLFLVAGQETTSASSAWALYAMTKAPEIQTKLREELLSVDKETPSMDELMALPYLDAVVREILRVHPAVPFVLRVAMKDDVLPVEKPYMDKNGLAHESISISKGEPILIPILAINHSQELWGPDAHEFRPERWQNIPEAVSQIPGVWGHLMTFLGGPRACIGYRFAIVEMKAFLFTFVRAFEFKLAVPVSEIGRKLTLMEWPVLRNDPESKPQLPLLLKPYERT